MPSKIALKLNKLLNAFLVTLIILFIASLPLIFLYALSVDEVLILLAYIPDMAMFVLFLLMIKAKKKYYNNYQVFYENANKVIAKAKEAPSEVAESEAAEEIPSEETTAEETAPSEETIPAAEAMAIETAPATETPAVNEAPVTNEVPVTEETAPAVEVHPEVSVPVLQTKPLEELKVAEVKVDEEDKEEIKNESNIIHYEALSAAEREKVQSKEPITTYYLKRSQYDTYNDIYDVINDQIINKKTKKQLLKKLLINKVINKTEFRIAKSLI